MQKAYDTNFKLATITSEEYYEITKVMLNSFNLIHPNNKIEKILIVDKIDETLKDCFKEFQYLKFVLVSDQLQESIRVIKNLNSSTKQFYRQLYFFEIFKLADDLPLIYVDSDVIFINKIDFITKYFDRNSIALCRDTIAYHDLLRNKENYEAEYLFRFNQNVHIQNTLNTGFALINRTNIEFYKIITEFISDIRNWEKVTCFLLDEYVLNKLKHHIKHQILDSRFNFRPHLHEEILKRENISLKDAVLIHFYHSYFPENRKKMIAFLKTSTISFRILRLLSKQGISNFLREHMSGFIIFIYQMLFLPRIIGRYYKIRFLFFITFVYYRIIKFGQKN